MKWILVAVLLPALFAAHVIGNRIRIMQTPEFQIDTHKRQLLLMHHFAYADPKVGPKGPIYHSPNKSLENYEFHRQRLRELGAACYRRVRLPAHFDLNNRMPAFEQAAVLAHLPQVPRLVVQPMVCHESRRFAAADIKSLVLCGG